MKNIKEVPTPNLTLRFDNMLKTILIKDIKSFKEKVGIITSNNQAAENQALAAA